MLENTLFISSLLYLVDVIIFISPYLKKKIVRHVGTAMSIGCDNDEIKV